MGAIRAALAARTRQAAAVAAEVRDGERVDYGMSVNQPNVFDAALAARRDELSHVRVRTCLSVAPRQVLECDPQQRHFEVESWHFSGYDRRWHDRGALSYVPFNFGEAPLIYRRLLTVDLAVIRTAPMDAHGHFNFGISASYLRALCDVARRVVVEVSPALPVCYGVENTVHVCEVDAVIDGGDDPLPELPSSPPTDIDRRVAAHIVERIGDGACLQIGIGGMPNAVCLALAEAPVRDLGIHTEMLVDGMVALIEAGRVTGARKQTHRGKVTYCFALGSRRLYEFVDRNELCMSLPVDETNLPDRIARNRNVVSINNCLMVDLSGQVCAESAGHRQISGTGGQLQFVRGAFMSEGGQSFLCCASRYRDADGRWRPRIVPELPPGSVVTTPRTDVMYVVTEYGIANLKGLSVSERARALIGLAHPDDRDELERAARERGLLPRRHR